MRVLVIGCGSIGRRHIKNLIALGVNDLVASDTREDSRQTLRTETDVEALGNLDEAWDRKPQVVFIATPTHLHVSLALQAAARGCHLFIEKPLAHTLEEAGKLCREAERRQLVTMVGCNMRFHPGPASVKRLLDLETIGHIIASRIQVGSYLPSWRPGQDYRQSYSASPEWGGAILDCIHELDLALWYFGPAHVVAAAPLPAATLSLDTDGLAEAILNHESGTLTSVHMNFLQRDYHRSCQVIGSHGTIYWDFSDREVRVYGPEGELVQVHSQPGEWELNQMYVDEVEHFLRSVRSGTKTVNPLSAGMAALELALSIRRIGSAQQP